MENVTSSNAIVEIAGTENTSGKLNMWANIIKWIIIILSIIIILMGLGMFSDRYTRATGLVMIVVGVLQGFMAFFYVYMLRAFAIITEAASIIVLEHQQTNEE